MTASPTAAEPQLPGGGPTAGVALRLYVVPTPQPPLADGGRPVRLVLPGIPPPRPPHRLGPRPVPARAARADADFGPTWSRRSELPDPRGAGRRLVTVTLEALAGRRPLAQVQPLASAGVFTALTRRPPPAWCTDGTAPILVGVVHVCEPVDGVAEISAVAQRDGRGHAVAARLEGLDGRWWCTVLQVD